MGSSASTLYQPPNCQEDNKLIECAVQKSRALMEHILFPVFSVTTPPL